MSDTIGQAGLDAANAAAVTDMGKMLDRVRKLIAKADDSACTPEESQTYHNRAQELMQKYRIAEEAAYADRPAADHVRPTVLEVRVCAYSSKYRDEYIKMMRLVAVHCTAKLVFDYKYDRELQDHRVMATLIGFETDLKYAEMLYISAQLVFATNMEPTWDGTRTEAENIFYLRQSGMVRAEITTKIYGREHRNSVAKAQRIQKIYLTECDRRGVVAASGRDVSRADFVKMYVQTFIQEFSYRLQVARQAADGVTGDTGLVLANRDDRIREHMYTVYPHLRPSTDLRKSEPYVDTRTPKQIAADEARWERQYQKERAEERRLRTSTGGRAGGKAGTSAAKQINLAGVQGTRRVGE